MKDKIIDLLTSKDDKTAWAFAEKIISDSKDGEMWYEYFDIFSSLLNDPKSLVRNRILLILSSLAKWDNKRKFDVILDEILTHITDPKPITSRQCIKALCEIGTDRKEYIPKILKAMKNADLAIYKESMRSLIEKDIRNAEKVLTEVM